MFLALVVAAALETPAPPSVELTRTGAAAAPVSAAPRSLSDVAREMRDGRRATGGFSAVESTVPRVPIDPWLLVFAEERRREEPDVAPDPEPAGYVSNEIYGWGGGWGPAPRRRPPHVSHHRPSVAGPGRERAGGGGRARVPAAGSTSSHGSRVLPLERRSPRLP